jgi:hypothetical protein
MANLSPRGGVVARSRLAGECYYCTTAVPALPIGARTLLTLDPHIVEATLGVLFFLMVPMRRWLMARGLHQGLAPAIRRCRHRLHGRHGGLDRPDQYALLHRTGLVKGAYPVDRGRWLHRRRIEAKTIVFQRPTRSVVGDGSTRPYHRHNGDGGLLGGQGFVLRLEADQFHADGRC